MQCSDVVIPEFVNTKLRVRRSVGFSLIGEATVIWNNEDEVDSEARTPWPIRVSLELEMTLPLVPRYTALDALYHNLSDVRAHVAALPKYDVELDRLLIPLLSFLQSRSSADLSLRQQALHVMQKVCCVAEAVIDELANGNVASHHSLLRPVKELLQFPGVLCECKRDVVERWRTRYFSSLPRSMTAFGPPTG